MNRKRRTKIFIDYGRDEAMELAGLIEEDYQVEDIGQPIEGLTMIKVRESAQNSLFYIGEVLVTQSKVRIQNQVGLGLVKGNEPDFARALAILDAAYELDLDITKKWTQVFEKCERRGLENLQRQRDIVASTKVEFETMDV